MPNQLNPELIGTKPVNKPLPKNAWLELVVRQKMLNGYTHFTACKRTGDMKVVLICEGSKQDSCEVDLHRTRRVDCGNAGKHAQIVRLGRAHVQYCHWLTWVIIKINRELEAEGKNERIA